MSTIPPTTNALNLFDTSEPNHQQQRPQQSPTTDHKPILSIMTTTSSTDTLLSKILERLDQLSITQRELERKVDSISQAQQQQTSTNNNNNGFPPSPKVMPFTQAHSLTSNGILGSSVHGRKQSFGQWSGIAGSLEKGSGGGGGGGIEALAEGEIASRCYDTCFSN